VIPYGRQHLDEDDVKAVVETLTSNWLTQGPAIPKFETALADYCGANFGIAVNSATSALHIACLALGVSEGDRVWTSRTHLLLRQTARSTVVPRSIS